MSIDFEGTVIEMGFSLLISGNPAEFVFGCLIIYVMLWFQNPLLNWLGR
jgi:hypothetical protein